MEFINGSLVMCHEDLPGALRELLEVGKTPSSSNLLLHHPPEALDVIVTTHKTIDLVFHTQADKLKRDMTRRHTASAPSVAFMHNDGMEVNDENPAHSPTADGGRPTPDGAPPQGAHDHSGTSGGQ